MEDLKKKILIVDDEVDFCLSLQDVLESRDYQVAIANTTDEGIAQLNSFSPDIALMDIRLGRENGIDLLRSFREADEQLICVMMTAYADTETAIDALKGGAYDYLRKPVSPDDLFATVNRCFERLELSSGKLNAENQLQKRNAELVRLNTQLSGMVAAAAVLASHQNDDSLPTHIFNAFHDNLLADAGRYYSLNKGKLLLEYALPEGKLPEGAAAVAPSVVLKAAEERRPLLFSPKDVTGMSDSDPLNIYGDGSMLIVPIVPPAGDVLGIVVLHRSAAEPFIDQDLELGLVFASLSAEVIIAKNAAAKFKSVVDTSNDAIVGADESLNINLFNTAAQEMFGYREDEAIGMPMFVLVPSRERQSFAQAMQNAVQGVVSSDLARVLPVVGLKKDGSIFPAELSWSGGIRGADIAYYAIIRDMTQRRLAERAVRESEHRYRTLFESAGDAILLFDGKQLSDCNEKALDMFGCTRDELIGRSPADFSPKSQPNGESSDAAVVRYVEAAYKEQQFFEWRHKRANGEEFDVEVSLNALVLDGRSVILAILRDVSLQKRMVRSLKASEERFSAIVRAVPSGIATITRKDLVYKGVNDAWQSIYQRTREEIIGQSLADLNLVGKTDMDFVLAMLDRDGEVDGYPAVIRTPDGGEKSILLSVRPVFLDDEPCILVVTMDVTELEDARRRESEQEQQLFQAAKMVSLGTLVSGVAHEINNPNNFIRLSSENLFDFWTDIDSLLTKAAIDDPGLELKGIPLSSAREMISKMFNGVFEGTKRIEKLILSLKDFSRKDAGEQGQQVNINAVVNSAVDLTSAAIRQATDHFSTNLDECQPLVKGNYHQIEQIVINLIANSCQALTKRSQRIEVVTECDDETDSVRVIVSDEGEGIPEENLLRITDPFFTTKRDVGGTGLGLSVSYRIAQNHDGNIIFRSRPDDGTDAVLILPAFIEEP